MSITWEGERPAQMNVEAAFVESGITGASIQPVGETGYVARFAAVSEEQHKAISAALAKRGTMREDRFETIGPSIGSELRRKSFWSALLIIVAISLYVAWAFRKVSRPIASWKYGIITIIALLHDVLIPAGAFALLGAFAGIEVNSAFIVALLTTMGYSVNDTIIVFDRTRENITRHGGSMTFDDVVNRSVNETLTRSLNTSLTTLLALIAIVLFGGESIRYFALALIIGITAGTYSSIFIASPLLVTWNRWSRR